MHRATRRFWECFDSLADDIQSVARKNYTLLKVNPRHPSLQELRSRGYKIDIFVGIFGVDDNMGLVLKNTLLRRVIQLGVDLDLDIYPA